jgi:hypothetical protein
MLGGEYIQVVQPVRQPRGRLVKSEGLKNAMRFALSKLSALPASKDSALVLILIDADEDCPAELGPKLLKIARKVDSRADLACVLINVEYETWFVAAAESLSPQYLDLASDPPPLESPEEAKHGKAWVERRFRGKKYLESQDQPAMTHAMDLALTRRRAPSFDKLCRELERRLPRPDLSD